MVLADQMMLRLVGFFKELGSSTHYAGEIREAIQPSPGAEERLLVQYLRMGQVVLDVPETATDVISGDDRIVGGPSLVTDGTWLWRLDLAHYVEKYHLALPSEFLDHARAHAFRVPRLSDGELERVGRDALRYF